MKLVSVEEMKEMEVRSADFGISTSQLMEQAGQKVAEVMARRWKMAGKKVLILVGPGNNGGDGLVAARHLDKMGAKVTLCLWKRDPSGVENLTKKRLPVIYFDDPSAKEELFSADLIVDALLGTGRTRPLEDKLAQFLGQVRETGCPLIAVDLPTGLAANTGQVDQACLRASLTITLGLGKWGLFLFPGTEYAGEVEVVDIGIPKELAAKASGHLLSSEEVKSLLPSRPPYAHKGTFGKLMVWAGSANYAGAAYLACMGAARVGTGLVTLAAARSLQPIFAAKFIEITTFPLPEAEAEIPDKKAEEAIIDSLEGGYKALLIGPGLGQHPSVVELVQSLISRVKVPVVVDADGLNALAKRSDWWKLFSSTAVLTPHVGEASRLSGLTLEEIAADRVGLAKKWAAQWSQVVVLKGARAVIAAPSGKVALSPFANAGLASAGTGDVMAGAIAGFLAQGLKPFEAACLGSFVHGLAGEIVRGELGDTGMLAGDVLAALPRAIKGLKIEDSRGWCDQGMR